MGEEKKSTPVLLGNVVMQLAEAAYADLTSAIGRQSILEQALDVANKDQLWRDAANDTHYQERKVA